jgi:hypothetical protein
MLFKGLVERLLGSDPEGPLKQSIESTPNSSSPLDLHGAEGVFPALQILRQARPPKENLSHIIISVEKLLASPHWHLRDMAARTIVSLRSTHELSDSVVQLLSAGRGTHNLQHGTLLAVKYSLRKLLADIESLGEFELSMHRHCPTISAAYARDTQD